MRSWFIAALVVVAAGLAGTLAYVPYLPQLLIEGFPPLVFAGKGQFAAIGGTRPHAADAREPNVKRDLVPALAAAFAESGGAALLAYRDGELALEHYGPGVSQDTQLNSYSMAKSLVGALVYKALAEGRIGSLDVTLGELLPDDRGLQNLTLRSLITMRAGIHFDMASSKFGATMDSKDSDTAPNPFGPLARLHFMGLTAIEGGLQLDTTPVGDFNYQNVNTALLGEVLEVVYGRPLEDLMAEKLWGPALAQTALWRKPNESASVSAYCCIYATARDWIHIGAYLVTNGTPDAAFLPDELWREFMGLDVDAAELRVDHYGQHILQNVLDREGEDLQGPFTYLMGQNGQILYLMPQRGLVVYRAGERFQLLHSTLYDTWNSLD